MGILLGLIIVFIPIYFALYFLYRRLPTLGGLFFASDVRLTLESRANITDEALARMRMVFQFFPYSTRWAVSLEDLTSVFVALY